MAREHDGKVEEESTATATQQQPQTASQWLYGGGDERSVKHSYTSDLSRCLLETHLLCEPMSIFLVYI